MVQGYVIMALLAAYGIYEGGRGIVHVTKKGIHAVERPFKHKQKAVDGR